MQCGCARVKLALEQLVLDDRVGLLNSLLEQLGG